MFTVTTKYGRVYITCEDGALTAVSLTPADASALAKLLPGFARQAREEAEETMPMEATQ